MTSGRLWWTLNELQPHNEYGDWWIKSQITCHLTVMLAGLSTLPILSLSALLLLRCRRSKSIFLSPAATAGELPPTVLRTCTERVWWCCDVMWPKREIFCAGVRLCNCAVLDGGEWSSFSSGSSYMWKTTHFYRIAAAQSFSNGKTKTREVQPLTNFGCLMCGISPRKVS